MEEIITWFLDPWWKPLAFAAAAGLFYLAYVQDKRRKKYWREYWERKIEEAKGD